MMKVIKQDIGRGDTRYNVFGRDERNPLVMVEVFSGTPSLTVEAAGERNTTREATQMALAILTGVEIMNAVNEGIQSGDILRYEE